MIAAETSAWSDYVKGIDSESAIHLENALASGNVVLPEPVLFEVLSWPNLPEKTATQFLRIPRLELTAGFWERAAHMRRQILKKKLKARGLDCLIAQNCIDHRVALICRDSDFRHFKRFGLTIVG